MVKRKEEEFREYLGVKKCRYWEECKKRCRKAKRGVESTKRIVGKE